MNAATPLSSSSLSVNTSPSVKCESDSELQSLNELFLQKKRLKQTVASSKKLVKEETEPQKKVLSLQKIKSSSTKSTKLIKETNNSKIKSNENDNDTTLPLEAKRIESDKTLQKLNSYIEKRKKDMETKKMLEKLHNADVEQQNSESSNSDDLNIHLTSNFSNSSDINNDDDDDIVYLDSKKSNKKEFNYKMVDFDEKKENEIDKLK